MGYHCAAVVQRLILPTLGITFILTSIVILLEPNYTYYSHYTDPAPIVSNYGYDMPLEAAALSVSKDTPKIPVKTGFSEEEMENAKIVSNDGYDMPLEAAVLSIPKGTPKIPVRTGLCEEEMEKAKMRQRERKKLMDRVCGNIRTPTKNSFSWNSVVYKIAGNFEVAPEYSLMNCKVNKAGSTPWNSLLAHLYHKEGLIKDETFYKMQDVLRPKGPQFASILKNQAYLRFLTTREPLSRVLSAYMDRIKDISHTSWQAHHFVPLILKQTRPTKQYSSSELFYSNGSVAIMPSFKEFAEYIVEMVPQKMDPHWRPVFHQCGVCLVNYTHIVLAETFLDDLRLIMRETGIDKEVDLSVLTLHSNKGKGKTTELMLENYATLRPSTLQHLISIYENDFIVFGYDPTEFLKNVSPNVSIRFDVG